HIATFLDAPRLGVESEGEIWLNADAAGWGWFTDATPGATPAAGRMDLLTVVEHEFGHVLFGVQDGTGLMEATLVPGVRLFPASTSPVETSATTALAPRALGFSPPSLAAVVGPSVEGPDLAAALVAARAGSALSPSANTSMDGTGPAILLPSRWP